MNIYANKKKSPINVNIMYYSGITMLCILYNMNNSGRHKGNNIKL